MQLIMISCIKSTIRSTLISNQAAQLTTLQLLQWKLTMTQLQRHAKKTKHGFMVDEDLIL